MHIYIYKCIGYKYGRSIISKRLYMYMYTYICIYIYTHIYIYNYKYGMMLVRRSLFPMYNGTCIHSRTST